MPIYLSDNPKFKWPVLVYAEPYTTAEWEQAMRSTLARTTHDQQPLLVDRRHVSAPTPSVRPGRDEVPKEQSHHAPGGRVAVVANNPGGL